MAAAVSGTGDLWAGGADHRLVRVHVHNARHERCARTWAAAVGRCSGCREEGVLAAFLVGAGCWEVARVCVCSVGAGTGGVGLLFTFLS